MGDDKSFEQNTFISIGWLPPGAAGVCGLSSQTARIDSRHQEWLSALLPIRGCLRPSISNRGCTLLYNTTVRSPSVPMQAHTLAQLRSVWVEHSGGRRPETRHGIGYSRSLGPARGATSRCTQGPTIFRLPAWGWQQGLGHRLSQYAYTTDFKFMGQIIFGKKLVSPLFCIKAFQRCTDSILRRRKKLW